MLSKFVGADAITLMADIMGPLSRILSDEEVKNAYRDENSGGMFAAVQCVLRRHPHEVIEILAYVDGKDPATYEVNGLTLPIKVMELLNDPEFTMLFPSQSQNENVESSGSATENIAVIGTI